MIVDRTKQMKLMVLDVKDKKCVSLAANFYNTFSFSSVPRWNVEKNINR